jgi:hypothetical protein
VCVPEDYQWAERVKRTKRVSLDLGGVTIYVP